MRTALRITLAVGFIVAGLNHFYSTEFYLRMMPPYLPNPQMLVYLSGAAEVILGSLALTRYQAAARYGLTALLMAVFPANVQMALHPELFPEFPAQSLLLRLPLQAVLIAWVFYSLPRSAPAVTFKEPA